MSSAHLQILLDCKRDIEYEFDTNKWTMIAEKFVAQEGPPHDGEVLRRQYKKAMERNGFITRNILVTQDVDFISGEEDNGDNDEDDNNNNDESEGDDDENDDNSDEQDE